MLLTGKAQTPALAQEPKQQQDTSQGLTILTPYPAQVVGIGETVTFALTLRNTGPSPQIVRLEVQEAPHGWTATFRGGGQIIQAVYVEPASNASASLRLEPPEDVSGGTYRFVVVARGEGVEGELPIELTVKEKLPPKLKFDVELPTLKGTPTTTFRYDATLRNEGDEDLTVNLAADAPEGFRVSFRLSGKEVTSLPLKANESKRLNIEVRPFAEIPAGEYPITVLAQGGEVQATIDLTAEVTGRPDLSVTAPDGRLSGRAYAGRETPLKIIVRNTGSAAARNVELSASEPPGWSVEFEPKQIAEIAAGEQVEVRARLRPAEKAVAGDYMVTIRARGEGGSSKSAEFRITVLTSTLWGVVGIALIAVAVVVVGLAVMRFGRR
ncbi:MAG: NEW3 domain-containing protein [Anaerolineae bacterium]